MKKEIMKKMARYVELSEKFSKSERDIFTEEELRNSHNNSLSFGMNSTTGSICVGMDNGIHFNGYGSIYIDGREVYVDEGGNVKAKDEKKPLTRGQRLEATITLKAKVRATLLDEYDEYIKLRTSLNNYFSGVNELINE